jgi:hypothetical protein
VIDLASASSLVTSNTSPCEARSIQELIVFTSTLLFALRLRLGHV